MTILRTAVVASAGAMFAAAGTGLVVSLPVTVPTDHVVEHVRDGDTITVPELTAPQLLFWTNHQPEGVRFLCVQAPERGKPGWAAARDWMRTRMPDGSTVRLEADPRPNTARRDTFGRMLAFVYTASGEDLNLGLVRQGLAPADHKYDCPRREAFDAAERSARSEHLGLWAAQ